MLFLALKGGCLKEKVLSRNFTFRLRIVLIITANQKEREYCKNDGSKNLLLVQIQLFFIEILI